MAENNNLLVKLDNCGVYKSSKWIVRGISLEIHKGKIVTLIGPNGSGKTTSAKMILKILKSDEGQIKNFASKMAYVPQKINIDWTMPLRVVDFMKLTSHINNLEIVDAIEKISDEQLLEDSNIKENITEKSKTNPISNSAKKILMCELCIIIITINKTSSSLFHSEPYLALYEPW